jgi:hypothetical protein
LRKGCACFCVRRQNMRSFVDCKKPGVHLPRRSHIDGSPARRTRTEVDAFHDSHADAGARAYILPARGTVVPESFAHGIGAERVNWFTRGFNSGQIDACDTFAGTPCSESLSRIL